MNNTIEVLQEIKKYYAQDIIRGTETGSKRFKAIDKAIATLKAYKKIKEQQLTEDEIEKVILDNKEIFIFEDSGMGEGIDYSKLAKAIIAKMKEKAE